jgi:hypothetical protein
MNLTLMQICKFLQLSSSYYSLTASTSRGIQVLGYVLSTITWHFHSLDFLQAFQHLYLGPAAAGSRDADDGGKHGGGKSKSTMYGLTIVCTPSSPLSFPPSPILPPSLKRGTGSALPKPAERGSSIAASGPVTTTHRPATIPLKLLRILTLLFQSHFQFHDQRQSRNQNPCLC